MPQQWLERMRSELGEEVASEVITAATRTRVTTVRCNTLRCQPQALADQLRSRGYDVHLHPHLRELVIVGANRPRSDLVREPELATGDCLIQGAASVAAVRLFAPQPDETILDLCAAPGAKASHIAALMEGRGKLIVNEPNRERCYRLRALLKKTVPDVESFVEFHRLDGARFRRHPEARVDRVLVDAPCSGEATFCAAEPRSFSTWGPSKPHRCARIQRRLLSAAWECLHPGGLLMYVTCTVAKVENEEVVEHFLSEHPEAEPSDALVSQPFLPAWYVAPGVIRLRPSGEVEPFFIAAFRKT